VTVCAISIAFFKQAFFGTDPFQTFCNGIANVVPIRFGTLYMLINLALLLVVFLLDKHYIGVATFINLFLLGYVVDFSEALLVRLCPEPSLALRAVYLVIGIVVMCYSSSLYITADLGVSTYDSIALYLAAKKIAPFRLIRIGTDLVCVLIGFLLGYKPGVGTLITAFFMGPLISVFNTRCAEPMLYGKGNQPRAARGETA